MTDAVSQAAAKLREAMKAANAAFLAADRIELSDLSSGFWGWLLELDIVGGDLDATPDELLKEVLAASNKLGAPGDFGYDTEHGQALWQLYQAHNALRNALCTENVGEEVLTDGQ